MKIDKNKLERQLIGRDRWFANNCRGTFEWVTGVGKTYGAILCMKKVLEIKPDASFIIVVPRDPLRDMWREEIKNHNIPNAKVDTIHMLAKSNNECDMLVLDELHMYVGKDASVFPKIFENTECNRILGLTATITGSSVMRDVVNANCPVIDSIPVDVALEEGFVSEYIQYNLGIPLSQEDTIKYARLNGKFYKHFGLFNNNFDLVKACLSQSGAERFASSINWDTGAIIGMARKTMTAIRERKQFLYGAPSKLDVAEQIINKFSDHKIITFSQTTEPADKLASRIDRADSYHSNINTRLFVDENQIGEKCGKGKYKLYEDGGVYSWDQIKEKHDDVKRYGTKRLRERILTAFKNGDITVLCSAQALDVGFDDDSINMGIVLSATSQQRQNIQRTGRVIRAKEGKRAIIIQLYILDTQDEKWLNDRQTNSENIKNIFSVEQIQI